MAQDTWNARAVAAEATKMLGRTVSPKQVRGLARGDNGAPVIARLDDEGYSAHVYTAKERTALLAAFAARESKRTGKTVKVPGVNGTTARPTGTTRKPAGKRKAAPEAPEAPEA